VQAAKGRTTIVIAHRLSTIKNADNTVMSEGRIAEQGTHDYFLEQKSACYNLIRVQEVVDENEKWYSLGVSKAITELSRQLDGILNNFEFDGMHVILLSYNLSNYHIWFVDRLPGLQWRS